LISRRCTSVSFAAVALAASVATSASAAETVLVDHDANSGTPAIEVVIDAEPVGYYADPTHAADGVDLVKNALEATLASAKMRSTVGEAGNPPAPNSAPRVNVHVVDSEAVVLAESNAVTRPPEIFVDWPDIGKIGLWKETSFATGEAAARTTVANGLGRSTLIHEMAHLALPDSDHDDNPVTGEEGVMTRENAISQELGLGYNRVPDSGCPLGVAAVWRNADWDEDVSLAFARPGPRDWNKSYPWGQMLGGCREAPGPLASGYDCYVTGLVNFIPSVQALVPDAVDDAWPADEESGSFYAQGDATCVHTDGDGDGETALSHGILTFTGSYASAICGTMAMQGDAALDSGDAGFEGAVQSDLHVELALGNGDVLVQNASNETGEKGSGAGGMRITPNRDDRGSDCVTEAMHSASFDLALHMYLY
jgi:hypothetical protein